MQKLAFPSFPTAQPRTLLDNGGDIEQGPNIPARRLLLRRSGWLLMSKTSKGCRVRTRVVMDGVSDGALTRLFYENCCTIRSTVSFENGGGDS